MIERADLMEDPDLPQVAKRFRRREEFLSAVHQYTTQHTTAGGIEAAALLRIPAGPLLNGSTMTQFEQFVARGVFVPGPSGRFLQPRVPYRDLGRVATAVRRCPGSRSARRIDRLGTSPGDRQLRQNRHGRGVDDDGWRLPLDGIRVVDCTAWWAGPVATAALAALGADVIKIESVTRPDNMRFASTRPSSEDRWWEWSPIFHAANTGKRGVTFDLSRPEGAEMLERFLRLPTSWSRTSLLGSWSSSASTGTGSMRSTASSSWSGCRPSVLDGPWRDRTGFAQTMECLTGMSWLTGFADGPPVLVRGACDPLAGMHAVIRHHAGPRRP